MHIYIYMYIYAYMRIHIYMFTSISISVVMSIDTSHFFLLIRSLHPSSCSGRVLGPSGCLVPGQEPALGQLGARLHGRPRVWLLPKEVPVVSMALVDPIHST